MKETKQLTVEIRLTEECQLRCKHCLASLSKKSMNFKTLKKTFEVIHNFIAKHSDEYFVEISLSGGEPTLYQHLPKVVSLIQDTNCLFLMHTNGIGLAGKLSLFAKLSGTILISNDRFHQEALRRRDITYTVKPNVSFSLDNLHITYKDPKNNWVKITEKNRASILANEVRISKPIKTEFMDFIGIDIDGKYYSSPTFEYEKNLGSVDTEQLTTVLKKLKERTSGKK